MQLWVAINGVKHGPVPDYEVRGKIESGEYGPGTMGWHEGLDEWVPLEQMEVFKREFAEKPDHSLDESSADGVAAGPVTGARPVETFWIRRFFARWLDIQLYSAAWWLGLYLANADIQAVVQDLLLMLSMYLPWVPVEAWLVSRAGTTPGKWLMGLRVLNQDGRKLDFPESLRRALRVYFLGIGIGWIPMAAVCHAVSWLHLKSMGSTLWDLRGGHRVDGKQWRWFRAPVFVFSIYMAIRMQMLVISPYVVEEVLKQYPEMRPWFEKNPPQHLPRRDGKPPSDS